MTLTQKVKIKKENTSPEELALKELKLQLSKKGLTPEAFYRTCDIGHKKLVPCE